MNGILKRIALTIAVLALVLPAAAAELKVFSTIALTEAWHELKPKFETRGHKLELVLQPSGALGKRISAGETGDAIVSTSAGVDGLTKNGKIAAGMARALASSGMGVAVLKGAPNADFVVKGESDIAIQQIPELMSIAGVDIVGPFPGDLHNITSFSAAVLSSSRNADAAKALVEFLASPETAALLKAKGFELAR